MLQSHHLGDSQAADAEGESVVRTHLLLLFLALVGLIGLGFSKSSNVQAQGEFPPCPAGEGPNRIWAGNYPPQRLYQEERNWLCQIFGDCRPGEQASVGYGGKSCNGAHMDPLDNFTAMICRSGAIGPGGIRPGSYDAVQLHDQNPSGQQWLWEIFREPLVDHPVVPVGWGGRQCPGDPQHVPPINPPPAPPQDPGGAQGGAAGQSGAGHSSQSSGGNSGSSNPTTGGLDLNEYCRYKGYQSVERIGPYARDWYCYNGSYYPIDIQDACFWQYSGALNHVGLRDANDPGSWYCANTPQPPLPSGGQSPLPPTGSGGVSDNQNFANSSGCSGAGSITVSVGSRARITAGAPNNLRSGAGIHNVKLGEIPQFTQLSIIGGPQCADGYRWWRVRLDNGSTGWTADGTPGHPWIELVGTNATNPYGTSDSTGGQSQTGATTSGFCSRAPSSIFTVGDRAIVVNSPSSDPLNVRSSPSNADRLVAALTDGAIVTIIGGPVCENGYRRWHIRTEYQIEGWVRDGRDSQRWLERFSASPTEGNPTDYDLGPAQTAASSAELVPSQCIPTSGCMLREDGSNDRWWADDWHRGRCGNGQTDTDWLVTYNVDRGPWLSVDPNSIRYSAFAWQSFVRLDPRGRAQVEDPSPPTITLCFGGSFSESAVMQTWVWIKP